MSFESLADFIAMDGHGLYVWMCYGVGLVIFLIAFLQPKLRRKQIVQDIQQSIRRAQLKQKELEQAEQNQS